MTSPALQQLAGALRAQPADLGHLDGLDESDLAYLSDAVRRRMEADLSEVEESIEEAVRLVPRPLRGRARKILFPGGHS